MSVYENRDFSNINTTQEDNHTYEEIFDEIRLSNDYSLIDQYQKEQNPKYENLVAVKPIKTRSFRIVALIVVMIVVMVVILSIILAILSTTSNLQI